jgi:hypothetical protein
MSILLVELNTDEVSIDEFVFPNRQKDQFIYEHLRHYCSKFYPLPTIEVRICDEIIVVTRGHFYLSIANEFRHQRIRAVIDRNSQENLIENFLKKSSVVQLDWRMTDQENNDELVSYVWLVIFFDRPLSQGDKNNFEEHVLEFFKRIPLPAWAEAPENRIQNMNYLDSGYCVELQAYIPVEDERWYISSKRVLNEFHLKYVSIASFQGRKFLV